MTACKRDIFTESLPLFAGKLTLIESHLVSETKHKDKIDSVSFRHTQSRSNIYLCYSWVTTIFQTNQKSCWANSAWSPSRIPDPYILRILWLMSSIMILKPLEMAVKDKIEVHPQHWTMPSVCTGSYTASSFRRQQYHDRGACEMTVGSLCTCIAAQGHTKPRIQWSKSFLVQSTLFGAHGMVTVF